MPKLSQLALKAAMIYLILGALGAAAYWINAMWPFWPPVSAISPTYLHLIVVGWLTQLVMAVMYWMFPVISKQRPRGSPALAWAAVISLNAGLLIRMVFEPWRALQPTALNGYALALSAVLQVCAAILFVGVSWARVRERGGQ
ncbi:MAG: hypothetical protein M1434_00645 [Chloroflexi bacterium]|nr:hypothetical protein [Chloroflexota bacterium]MCL5273241.1 hypothetical protein [Chloroflexota bacterium]